MKKRILNIKIISIFIIMLLFPAIYAVGQPSFSPEKDKSVTYRIDKQPDITNYLWQVFTNESLTSPAGPADVQLTTLGTGRENEIEVLWQKEGRYFLSITTTGGNGCNNKMAWPFDVVNGENNYPVAVKDNIDTYEDVANLNIDVLANDRDPDGDPLTLNVVTLPVSGGTIRVENGTIIYNPPLNYYGSDFFVYQICDDGNPSLCDQDTVFVEVAPVNDAPVANEDLAVIPYNITEISMIDVQSNDFDVDGDILTTSIIYGPTGGGTAEVINGDQISYIPAVGYIGSDTIIYRICDTGNPALCDSTTLIIRVTDRIEAIDDEFEIYSGLKDTFDILYNDIYFGDVEVELSELPDHGQVILNADGTIIFTADNNFSGLDSLSYELIKGEERDKATVYFNIKPHLLLASGTYCQGEVPYYTWSASLSGGKTNTVDIRVYDLNGSQIDFLENVELTGEKAWPGVSVGGGGKLTDPGVNLLSLRLEAEYNDGQYSESRTSSVNYPDCHINTVYAEADKVIITDKIFRINVLGNDYDDDNGEIDPASLEIVENSGPYHGTANVNSDGSISYIPYTRFSGLDSLIYKVCDDYEPAKACDTAIIRIEVIWQEELRAMNDYYTIFLDEEQIFDVASNDYDPNGLLAKSTVKLESDPENGNAFKEVSGNIRYVPNSGFVGLDSFSYSICNTALPQECDKAWVYVTVVENQPIIAISDYATTGAEEIITIPVLSNDIDAEDQISVTSLTITDFPGNGTAVISGSNIIYTPKDGWAGKDSFIYRVCDLGRPVTCDTAIVYIEVKDDNQPIVARPDIVNVPESESANIKVLSNDNDPDGALYPENMTFVLQPKHGQATINSDGSISYEPEGTYNGKDSIIYQICDNGPVVKCDTAIVRITVVENMPPVAVNDNINATNGTGTSYDILFNDYDVDGVIDRSSVKLIDRADSGMISVSQATGAITYIPDECFFGLDSASYQVADNSGNLSNIAKIYIDVKINPNLDSDGDGASDLAEDINKNGTNCDDDTDEDGLPNYLDPDDDQDGITSIDEDHNFSGDPSDDDSDKDGIADYLDDDDDDDTIATLFEDVNKDNNYLNDDTDFDGTPNFLDPDDDGDGIATKLETGDLDGNGKPDYLENWQSAAVKDVLTMGLDLSTNINVLANDSSQMNAATLFILRNPSYGYANIDQNTKDIKYTPNADFIGLDTMEYVVCDYQGRCDTALVIVNVEDIVFVPELFTPNGDRVNDYFVIGGLDKYPENAISIYNRWGNKVYEKEGYQNDWDGLANVQLVIGSKELPVGVYYYVLKYNKGKRERSGALFLER